MRPLLCILTAFIITCSSFASKLNNLNYKNNQLALLRKEIAKNLRRAKKGQAVQVKWRRYTLKKNDNFFLVMARTMQNHDTLSSVNRLASLYDLRDGETWLIPNVRGIAVYGRAEGLAKKYKVARKRLLPVPGKKGLYFIAGRRFARNQRPYFNLSVFIRPVAGQTSSGYGSRRDPFLKKHSFHKGIDIACPQGSSVKASARGKVIFTGNKGGYGKTVIVEHENGYQTLYGHLSKIQVKKNQLVNQGENIAKSGSTGRSTGPHLHFEVRRKGRAVKPRFHQKQVGARRS